MINIEENRVSLTLVNECVAMLKGMTYDLNY